MWYAARYSPAVGIPKLRRACAGIGAVGVAASISTDFSASTTLVSCVLDAVEVVSGFVAADAATSVMVAPANAGTGTNDNSIHSPAVTTMVPSSVMSYSVGLTPTDTLSMTPSLASSSASLPAAVLLTFAVNSMPSAVSTRSVTRPTGWLASWYMNSLGALPSTGRLPCLNMTRVPSVTVAVTL